MSSPFKTIYTLAEITGVYNALAEAADDLISRNGENFRTLTVDIIGRAEDAIKIVCNETEEPPTDNPNESTAS